MSKVDSFLERLQAISLIDVFNPYADRCGIHDREDAVEIRRQNLRSALHAAVDLKVETIWIARDLGYRGGRRTGLALTDEAHLATHAGILGGTHFARATIGPLVTERTATTIWRMIAQIKKPIFMWNAFPLHPHETGNPLSNRCHTRAELKATSWVLPELIDILKPEAIYTIGADAKRCLNALDLDAVAFRHPSYGGQPQFIREVKEVYQLTETSSMQSVKQLSLNDQLHNV